MRDRHYDSMDGDCRPTGLSNGRDCARNLAPDPEYAEPMKALRQRMETMLKAQGDLRVNGRGEVFDHYIPTEGDELYEKFMRGENVATGWVNPTDFEKEPIKP
jgi:hypothetical protein